MNRLSVSILILMFAATLSNAQKVDIDKTRCKIEVPDYPTYDLSDAEKTYKMEYSGASSFENIASDFTVPKFKMDEENPNFVFKLHVNGFNSISPKVGSRKEEKKDKDGKVVSK